MTVRRAFATLALAIVLPAASQAAPPATAVPLSVALARLGEYGETIYDAVKAGNWSTARRQLTLVRQTAAAIAQRWPSNSEVSTIESALSGVMITAIACHLSVSGAASPNRAER